MGLISKYHVEDLPGLEAEYDALLRQLNEQRNIVAELKKEDADTENYRDQISLLFTLNNRVEKLKGEIDYLRKTQDIGGVMNKLDAIMDKNNCLRVRFYDWLAAKLESLAARIRIHAMSISKPCVVKLPKSKDSMRAELTKRAKHDAKKEANWKQFLKDLETAEAEAAKK